MTDPLAENILNFVYAFYLLSRVLPYLRRYCAFRTAMQNMSQRLTPLVWVFTRR